MHLIREAVVPRQRPIQPWAAITSREVRIMRAFLEYFVIIA